MFQYKQQSQRSSGQKLPPIIRFPSKQLSKQRLNRLDVSLQIIKQMSKHKILAKAGSPKRYNTNISNNKVSLRLRTDSVNANISYDKILPRQKDLKSEQYQSQKTLQDFHKNIKINKQYIHRQIKKRTQKMKMQSKQNSRIILQQNQQKLQKKKKQKRRVTQDSVIFDEIQDIFSRKLPFSSRQHQKQRLNFSQVKNALRMAKVSKNNRYLNPESVHQIKKSFQEETDNSSSRIALKDENNYHQWRRVILNSNQKSPKYKATNFQLQSQRLKQYVLKNQISLSNYFQFKNQLYLCNKLRKSS